MDDQHYNDVTKLLVEASEGSKESEEKLYSAIYTNLQGLARSIMVNERSDHTLQPTALVNEAYCKLVDQKRVEWKSRGQFFAVAARAIRRILTDYARRRASAKRGGGEERLPLDIALDHAGEVPQTNFLALDMAIEKLEAEDPAKAQIVELRFFAGLKTKEIASVLGVSTRTVENHWQFARAWLYKEISGKPPE